MHTPRILLQSSPPWHELEPFDPADMYLPWYHDKFKLRDHPWIQEAFGQHDEDEADTEAPEQLAKKRRTRTKEKDPDAIELEGPLAKALAVHNTPFPPIAASLSRSVSSQKCQAVQMVIFVYVFAWLLLDFETPLSSG